MIQLRAPSSGETREFIRRTTLTVHYGLSLALSLNLNSNGYLDNFQSGFRMHHSTETVLIKIINDIRFNSDSGKISVLVLLDLSAAFGTVDHNILLERLENWVGLSGMALKWFRSYLEGRGYYVSIGEHKSKWTSMTCGVPQGSILVPLLFSLYMLPLSQIMRKNQIAYHSYADDTQIYLALSPNDYSPIDSLCQCIDEINSWMCQNFLQLTLMGRLYRRRYQLVFLKTSAKDIKNTPSILVVQISVIHQLKL